MARAGVLPWPCPRRTPFTKKAVTMPTTNPCSCEICEETRLRREVARLKKSNKNSEEKNVQTKREIIMIQKNYEVISKYMAAMTRLMRNARDRDVREAPVPREERGREGKLWI